jgi:hypothetical protein
MLARHRGPARAEGRLAMTDEQIIQRLHDGFRSGAIPRVLPAAPAGDLQGREAMIANGGRGQPCSACGERIGPLEESMEYRYASVTTRFQGHCDALYLAERQKPLRRG